MNPPDTQRLVLIPAYNAGALLEKTLRGALQHWRPVWVVDDGSTDGSVEALRERFPDEPGLRVIRLPRNGGKGAALFAGAREAREHGFSHALTLDADDQHDTASIPAFMRLSEQRPDALVMGRPRFAGDAPRARVWGRKINIFWTDLETGFRGLGDTLFGFRVYPLEPFCRVMEDTAWARRFDFDPEIAVRLHWAGVPPLSLETPVRYHNPSNGGVSHFHYVRDNLLLTWMHTRLVFEGLEKKAGALLRRGG